MKVILLEKIQKLGDLGQEISVKAGFARNYLFPQYKAIIANKKNKLFLSKKLKEIEKNNALEIEKIKEKENIINNIELKIIAKASDKGKLFGSITNKNIASIFEKHNIIIPKNDINTQCIINEIGSYEIIINLKNNIKIIKQLNVIKEQ